MKKTTNMSPEESKAFWGLWDARWGIPTPAIIQSWLKVFRSRLDEETLDEIQECLDEMEAETLGRKNRLH